MLTFTVHEWLKQYNLIGGGGLKLPDTTCLVLLMRLLDQIWSAMIYDDLSKFWINPTGSSIYL